MKKSELIVSLVVMLGCLLIYSSSFAFTVSEVKYNLFDTGVDVGVYDVYRYDYTVSNLITSTDPINVFAVAFDPSFALFPGDDPLAVNAPDSWSFDGIPDNPTINEWFTTMTLSAVIQPGDSLSGFSINFLALDPNSIGDQTFSTIDIAGNQFIGTTAPIPEPGTMILMGISITSFWAYSKKRMKN